MCDEDRATCVCPNSDQDGDGARSIACGGSDCDDTDARRYPGAPEVCDALDVDEDCNPDTFGVRDQDGDGVVDVACCNGTGTSRRCGIDCNDSSASVHPYASEVCNQQDDNCNGVIDEGLKVTAYPDVDGDGYGATDAGLFEVCPHQLGQYALLNHDCDDTNAAITPGTFVCVGKQIPGEVSVCDQGQWLTALCAGVTVCVTQPTGIGVCR